MIHARRESRRDDGITLVELLVAMSIGVLVLTMLGGFFVATVRGTAVSQTADGSTRQATTAVNTMVRYLHAASTYPVPGATLPNPAIVKADPTDLIFYAYVNLVSSASQPVEVEYTVDLSTHNLVEHLWSSTCSATTQYCTFSGPPKSLTLGGPIATPTSDGKPLFSYFTANNNPPTGLGSIGFVDINLELGSSTAGSPGNTHISTKVGLLNLGQGGAGTS